MDPSGSTSVVVPVNITKPHVITIANQTAKTPHKSLTCTAPIAISPAQTFQLSKGFFPSKSPQRTHFGPSIQPPQQTTSNGQIAKYDIPKGSFLPPKPQNLKSKYSKRKKRWRRKESNKFTWQDSLSKLKDMTVNRLFFYSSK